MDISLHKQVRQFIEDRITPISGVSMFFYGRITDINQEKDKSYPLVVLDLLTSTETPIENSVNFNHSYNVGLSFLDLDDMDSTQSQYTLILDEMDLLCEQFITNLQFEIENTDSINSNNIEISSISKSPTIKTKLADCVTGQSIIFTLTVPGKFNYCS